MITQNYVGLDFGAYSNKSVLTDNNIYGNTNGSITLVTLRESSWQSTDINATYNWWGTTNTTSISQSIHDSKNDSSLGAVIFTPILTAKNPEARLTQP
jgi:nitrous oxidase accessory protein NosD